MVDDVRAICIESIYSNISEPRIVKPDSMTWDEFHEEERRQKILIETPFHSPGMTAKPLFDIMRAIIAETVNIEKSRHYSDRLNYKAILAHIQSEYDALHWKRNELLHGTWFIGYTDFDDPNASQFDVRKYKITADGLKRASELPKNADELRKLTARCNDARDWIGMVGFCLSNQESSLTQYFKYKIKSKKEREWKLFMTERSSGTTLPKR